MRFTVADGLSQSWVKSIYQDSKGFMWFGTNNGLNKYNGKEFKHYKVGSNLNEGLRHSAINDITEISSTKLFICTNLGAATYNYKTDSFTTFAYLKNIRIKQAIKDSKENLWLATENGLYKRPCSKDTLISFKHDQNDYYSISNNNIQVIYEDSNSNIWIGTYNGLNIYNRETKQFKRYLPNKANSLSIKGNIITAIYEDKEKRLWVGTSFSSSYPKTGLYIFKNYNELPVNKEALFLKVLSGNISTILADNKNNLWIGKGGGEGLTVLDLTSLFINRRNNTIQEKKLIYNNYYHTPYRSRRVSDNTISSLYMDINNDIWIGTFAGGVNLFSERIKPFGNMGIGLEPKKSLQSNIINAIYDIGDYIWIGTEQGLNKYNKKEGAVDTVDLDVPVTNKLESTHKCIYALEKDKKDNLWVGTYNGGLHRYNKKTDSFTNYLPGEKEGDISSSNILDIKEDSTGNIWIGTMRGGLNKYCYKKDSFTLYMHNPNDNRSIAGNSINYIVPTKDKLYISTYTALNIFDIKKETFEHLMHDPGDPTSLSPGYILCMHLDSNDNLWIGTNTGLNLYNKKDKTFKLFNVIDGLPSNTIQAITEDESGNLWLSTNQGLTKFHNGTINQENPSFKIYTTEDGLPGNDFSVRAVHKNREDTIFFGSTQGLTIFNPENIKKNSIAPPIIISNFNLIHPSKPSLNLTTYDISQLKELKLSYNQNNFTINFAALNYISPSKNQYKFKLKGHEDEWRKAKNLNFATYTNISPGSYQFMVKGSNNDKVWNPSPATLNLKIVQPVWTTSWFRISALLVSLLLIAVIIRLRVKILERQNKVLEYHVTERTKKLTNANQMLEEKQNEIIQQNEELNRHRFHLEQLIDERTAELIDAKDKAENADRLKTSFLANMSHEIRTPMNAIIGFSNLLFQEDLSEEDKKEYIKIINDNSESLLRLINDILDISKIEADEVSLKKERFNVNYILEELEKYYQLNKKRKIEVKITEKDKNLFLFNDPIRLRQVISNLLSNAEKHTESGYVHFGYKVVDNSVLFFVEDSGSGINKKDMIKVFNPFYKSRNLKGKLYRGTGIGLSICKKLVKLMGGDISAVSEPGKGSRFTFTVPLT
ncbi:two-component regulator propeller domain-containing protein [Marinilabiliaceae bacterium ANBcel2]|nr:two-component regulator propeller domain-containing protein [Marinilabiliaceae bacterium ANBcel2]